MEPDLKEAYSLVLVQRCEEHDGFDKKVKYTPILEFYLQGNPGRIIRECKQGFYVWVRDEYITSFHHHLSVHQVKYGLGAGKEASH